LKHFSIKRYEANDYEQWNAFVSQAKNATFLFHRDFMEYHQDRFEDFSLLAFENEKLIAILPANKVQNTVYSHQGLTYGGLVLLPKAKMNQVIEVFKTLLKFLNDASISNLFLKQIPSIYCDTFSDEMDYLSYVCQAKLQMKHAISVVNLNHPIQFSRSRRKCANRGKKLELIIKEETDFSSFWNDLLIPNLKDKYHSKPVHTLEEITFLRNKFPENIRHFNVYQNEKLVCGTTLFITKTVVKPQYISGTENNNLLGSIDFLYDYLIKDIAHGKAFFDFGPSHENHGLQIVENINFWKESFGAHIVVQNFYEINTSNFSLLDTILI
jgi:hypothetical protein